MKKTNEDKKLEQIANTGISDSVYEDINTQARERVRMLVDSYFTTNRIDSEKMKEIITGTMDKVLEDRRIIQNLYDIKCYDEYTFGHSINVSVYSVATAIGMGYMEEELKELGTGAVLHDIGKLDVSAEILKKPAQSTVDEFKQIKKHTTYGYKRLKDFEYKKISPAYIALNHHERCDGTGYPNRIQAEDIYECVRIVMIADVYDALTSKRVYREKQSPDTVMSYINDLGMHQFDKNIVNYFKKSIAIYPVGTGVVLNTSEKALVLKVNVDVPTRPLVRMLYDSQGNKIENYKEVDLGKEWQLFIVDSCDL